MKYTRAPGHRMTHTSSERYTAEDACCVGVPHELSSIPGIERNSLFDVQEFRADHLTHRENIMIMFRRLPFRSLNGNLFFGIFPIQADDAGDTQNKNPSNE